jgi:hypothetical protein
MTHNIGNAFRSLECANDCQDNINMIQLFNDVQLDVGPYLLTCIFERAWGNMVAIHDWASDRSKEVKGTLCVLEWLGLVEPDESSHLGFKPTHVLMSIVMARGNQLHTLERPPSNREECALDCILGTALGRKDRQGLDEWVYKVLHALGLVSACHDDDASDADQGKDEEEIVVGIGDWAPTYQLLLLAAIRADKDGDRWWIKFLVL